MNTEEAARAFKALGDENRLRIVELVAGQGEICACRILDELDIAHPFPPHEAAERRRAGQGEEAREMDALLDRQIHARKH